jgi:uncharacterized membrane protein
MLQRSVRKLLLTTAAAISSVGAAAYEKLSVNKVTMEKSVNRTVATVTTSAVSGGTTWGVIVVGVVVVVVTTVVPTPVIAAPVVVPAGIVATTALVSRWRLRIISTTTLEATFGALGSVKGFVNTNSTSIESINCQNSALIVKMR